MKTIKRIFSNFKNQPLVIILFVLLFTCLFLGDGKQTIVDTVGAGGVLSLWIYARFYLTKQREIDRKLNIVWGVFLLYLLMRTIFSDDVGYSIYSYARYIEAYLIYYIFHCYSNKDTPGTFINALLIFTISAITASVLFVYIPGWKNILPSMNLLYPTYGHNNIVNIVLFGYPAAIYLWHKTRKKRYIYLTILYVATTAWAMARAALLLEISFGLVFYGYLLIKKQVNNKAVLIILFILLTGSALTTTIGWSVIQQKTPFVVGGPKSDFFDNPRLEYWRQAVVAIKERPLFGSGPGTFYLQSKRLQSGPDRYSWFAHNFLLEFVVETGLAGLLIFFVIFIYIVRLFNYSNKQSLTKINKDIVLIGVFILAAAQVDYYLNYLITWLLFWALIGVYKNEKIKLKEFNQKETAFFFVVPLSFFYLFTLAHYFGVRNTKILYENEKKYFENARNNSKITKIINLLHKKNHDIKKSLGHDKEALFLDPKNVESFTNLLNELIQKNNYQEINKVLIETAKLNGFTDSNNVLKKALQNTTQKMGFDQNIAGFVGKPNNNNEAISKILYYLGFKYLEKEPQKSLDYWLAAQEISPGWGHFHVELASFYSYKNGSKKKSIQVLNNCRKYVSSAKQCSLAIQQLTPPGYLFEDIKMIPRYK